MRQSGLKWNLSRRLGIGARRVALTPSTHEGPPALPLGHPHLGLRDAWYLLLPGDDLGDEPVGLRVLGEDLVVWRGADGRPRLMTDYCPHRGAKLSLGDVVEGELRCWYHGWRFDGEGQCTSVPTQGGRCALQAKTRVRPTYPVVERGGYVFGWIGDAEPDELRLPAELEDSSYSMFHEEVEWGCNWLLALENVADVLHAPFLHNQSLTLGGGTTEDKVLVSDTDDGFRVERKGQAGINFDWAEFGTGSLLWVRLDIPYPSALAGGPGPDLRILGFATPIDDVRTRVVFPRLRRVDGWQRTLWRALFRLRLRGTHLHVLNQDKMMLESLRSIPQAQRDEHFAQSDRPVLHLRRLLQPRFDAALAALGPEWESSVQLNGTRAARVAQAEAGA